MSKKKAKKGQSKPSSKNNAAKFKEFLRSKGFARLCGSLLILFSLFLFIAILSFYVKGAHIENPGDNWMGMVGGWFALRLTARSFGVGALGILLILFLLGIRLCGRKTRLATTVWITLFWMVWVATFFGYIAGHWLNHNWDPDASSSLESYAGSMGYFISGGLFKLISWFTFVILLFSAAAVLIFVHKVRLHINKDKWQQRFAEWAKRRELRRAKRAEQSRLKAERKAQLANQSDQSDQSDPSDNPAPPEKDSFEDFLKQLNQPGENPAPETVPEVVDLTGTLDTQDSPTNPELNPELNPNTNPDPNSDGIDFKINMTDGEAPSDQSDDSEHSEYSEYSDITDPDSDSDSDYSRHFGVNDLYDPHLDLGDFIMPSTDILEDWETANVKVTKEELIANKDRIVQTLRDYGIEITEITATPGPTVTLYKIKPAPGVRISKIKNLEDDIALSLAALGIRIIAPIPGESNIGIEVPNAKPQIVAMKTMLESDAFRNAKMELPIAFGKTISNEVLVADLAKMPHLLMAGATGTGKSVGLNAVLASLLYKKHPSELKLVLVDPKKVEFSLYSAIERHYLAKMPDEEEAVITDTKKVVRTLNSLCIEMDSRYDLLKLAGVRKITEYNDKFIHRRLNPEHGHRYLPYIVVIIDEFGDLIMTAGKEVELPIARIAQLARAVGIHLIIATQRPTTNIITGTIKANFPARAAFRVTSGIDSKTILDTGGAQQLIGRGDMLISLAGKDMIRLQCALIDTPEIEKLTHFIGDQRGYSESNIFMLPEYLDENDEPTKDFDPKQKDEFFNDAARLVVASQFGSTSLLQRKLQLGYNRAGRIIDQLEAAGIVGPYKGSKARDVLIKDEVELEEILRNL